MTSLYLTLIPVCWVNRSIDGWSFLFLSLTSMYSGQLAKSSVPVFVCVSQNDLAALDTAELFGVFLAPFTPHAARVSDTAERPPSCIARRRLMRDSVRPRRMSGGSCAGSACSDIGPP